jgi:hypothetical protein
MRSFKSGGGGNTRSAAGAYEQPSTAPRGFGPLDPDDAWDTRVGHEADQYGAGGYYEEQELSGRGRDNLAYTGAGYDARPIAAAEEEERGRPRSRSPGMLPRPNPFDDSAEPSNISLRGVSPKPMESKRGGSPHSERRSIFREDV